MRTRLWIVVLILSVLALAPLSVAQALDPCCAVVANAALKGRLGQLVVAYPAGSKADNTRTDVYKAGATKSITGFTGNRSVELLPGTYDVVISGKRVTGVTITSGHDTKVRVGVIRINAGANTRVDLMEPVTGKALVGTTGNQDIGLPIGTVNVLIAGQTEAVTISEGKITDF